MADPSNLSKLGVYIMSDTNAYVNAYIDNAVGMIHENINVVLQLKTQVKIANDIIKEKDGLIGSLMSQLESSKNITDEVTRYREVARQAEETQKNAVSKMEHMDTAMSQISSMKSEIKKRDSKILELEETLKKFNEFTSVNLLETSKKTINTKRNKVAIVAGNAVDELPVNNPAIAGTAIDEVPTKKVPEDDF
jgi:vacuolar-type H+-ATPase subunit I/STV1